MKTYSLKLPTASKLTQHCAAGSDTGWIVWRNALGCWGGKWPNAKVGHMSDPGGLVSAGVLCEATVLLSPRAVMEEGMPR